MRVDFAANTRRNTIAAGVNRVVSALFPFLNRTLFLWLLGPAYLGLNGLFASILGVLMLAELGFGGAVISSMYKPVAENNKEELCAYLHFFRTVYRLVGAIVFVVGLCLMPFLRKLVHGDVPPDIDLHILFLLQLINTSASYSFFAYRASVLSVYHRQDVATNIRTVVSVAQYIAVFLILLLTRNYYLYVIVTIAFTVLQNLLVVREAQRRFPEIVPRGKLPPGLRRKVMDDVQSVFMHKIGGVITYSLGNVLISAFLGLVAVAAYGNDYYVYTNVAGLPWAVYYSMAAGFGNRIHTESREENFQLLMRANRMVSLLLLWCGAMMAALYQPFIFEWTRGRPELMCHILTPILMVVFFFVNQSRQVLLTFKAGAALWRPDRWKPIVSGIVNLGLTVVFIKFFPEGYKLDGVILATLIAVLFVQIPWEFRVVFSTFFTRNQAQIYRNFQFSTMKWALLMCGVTWLSVYLVPVGGISGFLVKGVVATAVSSALIVLIFREEVREIVQKGLKRH